MSSRPELAVLGFASAAILGHVAAYCATGDGYYLALACMIAVPFFSILDVLTIRWSRP